MKQIAKKVIRKTPGIGQVAQRFAEINRNLSQQQAILVELQQKIAGYDPRLNQLKTLLADPDVEHYQPTYHIAGLIDSPARSSHDRCVTIESALLPIAGKRILDIGSSLGYVSYFMADRGAVVQGWESNAKNAEASRMVGQINGIPVDIRTKEFNLETIDTIPEMEFDVAIMLSVAHHIIRFNGLEYTQKLMKSLIEKVPIVVVELAKKGEDPKLPWDASQPKDELAIFDLVKDEVTIKKIGDFTNHLSKKTRPLYVVSRKQVLAVNNHNYTYDTVSNVAYKDSVVAYDTVQRRYYFNKDVIIKEYVLGKGTEKHTIGQILNEIQLLTNLSEQKIHNLPQLIDFEVRKDRVFVVVKRVSGELLSETRLTSVQLKRVATDVLRTIKQLHGLGINHNDVRGWNVVVDKKGAGWLIDYGLAGPIKYENDMRSFLNVLASAALKEKAPRVRHDLTEKEIAEKMPEGYGKLQKLLLDSKGTVSVDEVLKAIQ